MWNIAPDPIDARVTLPPFVRAAGLVRLDETPVPGDGQGGPPLDWTPGPPPAVAFRAGPREILTLRLAL